MKRTLLALTLLAAAPFAASAAEGLSYNYVQGGYIATNNNDSVPDADGWGLNGSVAVGQSFNILGGYNTQEIDNTNFNVDEWKLGVGYHYGLTDKTDLVTSVAYQKLNPDIGSNLNGYSAEVGVRGAIAPKFEGYAMAGYEDYKKLDGNFYGRLGANVKFNDTWGLNGDVKFADGDAQWFIGPRVSW